MITPIEKHGQLWIKREDTAEGIGDGYASGAKVRQYLAMCKLATPEALLVVGCSAYSCQQVYIADARRRTGRRAVVFTAARKKVTAATQYCLDAGCEVRYVRPGYLSTIRARAKEFSKENDIVRWNPGIAARDAMAQAAAYDNDMRIVVPVGSGAMLAGVLAGLAKRKKPPEVLGVRVSPMCTRETVLANYLKLFKSPDEAPMCPDFELVHYDAPYEDGLFGKWLGDARLDPWYAAKAASFLKPGDCLWNTGRRPVQCMK